MIILTVQTLASHSWRKFRSKPLKFLLGLTMAMIFILPREGFSESAEVNKLINDRAQLLDLEYRVRRAHPEMSEAHSEALHKYMDTLVQKRTQSVLAKETEAMVKEIEEKRAKDWPRLKQLLGFNEIEAKLKSMSKSDKELVRKAIESHYKPTAPSPSPTATPEQALDGSKIKRGLEFWKKKKKPMPSPSPQVSASEPEATPSALPYEGPDGSEELMLERKVNKSALQN